MDAPEEALQRAAWLAAAYPGRTVDEVHIASWAEVLAPLTEHEVDDVIAMLRLRAADPPSVAQISECIREVRRETMSPGMSPNEHVYAYETECPVCLVIHGDELESGQVLHGVRHLADDDLQRAVSPERCDCGFDVPQNIDVEAVVGMVARGLIPAMKEAYDARTRRPR